VLVTLWIFTQKGTMEKLLISFVLLAVLSACGVKKLTPARGFYMTHEKESQTQSLSHKVAERQSEERIKPSEKHDDIESLTFPSVINDHSANKDSYYADSVGIHVYNEKIPVIENGLKKAFNHNLSGNEISKFAHESQLNSVKRQPQKTGWGTDVDWELLGLIGFYALLAVVIGFAYFGTGSLAVVATIILAIGYTILLIAAVVCILWFLNFVFFGWLNY
jgi:hypothetical protein